MNKTQHLNKAHKPHPVSKQSKTSLQSANNHKLSIHTTKQRSITTKQKQQSKLQSNKNLSSTHTITSPTISQSPRSLHTITPHTIISTNNTSSDVNIQGGVSNEINNNTRTMLITSPQTSITSFSPTLKSPSSNTRRHLHIASTQYGLNGLKQGQKKIKIGQNMQNVHAMKNINVQNATFFTSVTNKIKNIFTPSGNSDPITQHVQNKMGNDDDDEINFQIQFTQLPETNQKHIQDVMERFRNYVATRPNPNASITHADKEDFIAKHVKHDELISLQYESGSQHFFGLTKPMTPFPSNLPTKTKPQAPKRTVIDKDSPEYDEMMKNNMRRYHEGELNAKLDNRKQQMIKDSMDNDVFHLDLEDVVNKKVLELEEIQQKYEHNPEFDIKTVESATNSPTEFRLINNPDGSVGFELINAKNNNIKKNDQSSTNDNNALNNDKIKVPVDGTPTAIGMVTDPRLLISFICDMCKKRNVKSIPKKSYEKGVVLIRCDCDADHLIADNLGWFDDSGPLRIDRIMKEDKNAEIFTASVLDMNKSIKTKYDMSLGPEDVGKDVSNQHITPELMDKINEALKIAREADEKKSVQFKHFHHQDMVNNNIKNIDGTTEIGSLPLLPGKKTVTVENPDKM